MCRHDPDVKFPARVVARAHPLLKGSFLVSIILLYCFLWHNSVPQKTVQRFSSTYTPLIKKRLAYSLLFNIDKSLTNPYFSFRFINYNCWSGGSFCK